MPSSKLPNTITNSDDYQAAVKSLETLSLGNQAAVVAICNAARYGWLAATKATPPNALAPERLATASAIAKDLKSKLPEDCRSYRQYFTVNALAMGAAINDAVRDNPDFKYPRSPDVLRAAIPLFAIVESPAYSRGFCYMAEVTGHGPSAQDILADTATLTYDAFKAKYGPDVWGDPDDIAANVLGYATTWRPPAAKKAASPTASVQSTTNFQFDSVAHIVNWLVANVDKLTDNEVTTLSDELSKRYPI